MSTPSIWRIEWYVTDKGEQPFRAFLRNLESDDKNLADAVALLELLEVRVTLSGRRGRSPLGRGCSNFAPIRARFGSSTSFDPVVGSSCSTAL